MKNRFTQIISDNVILNRVLTNLSSLFNELESKSLLDYTILSDINISHNVEGTVINHKLNRPIQGWIIIKKTEFFDIKELNSNSRTLTLRNSTSQVQTISLLIF